MDKETLKNEIVKRLHVLDASKPPFLAFSEADKLAYLRRYFDGFFKSMRAAGAVKAWYYGIDTKNPLRAKIKVVLEGFGKLKLKEKHPNAFFYYDVEVRRAI
jgi:hypothetical protein